MKLRIGLSKGSLQKTTFELFEKAGFKLEFVSSRSYLPRIDDDELEPILLKAQEIPLYVEQGILDVGLTGRDWIVESRANVLEVEELVYAKQGMRPVKWVLAVPNESPISSVKDLEGKRIATELLNVTKDYLKRNGITADVEFSWGSTEIKPGMLVDAIVELTETGTSLKANNLRIVDTVMVSTTRIIVNKDTWENSEKRRKVESLSILLKGALEAYKKVGLKMNVPFEKLEKVLTILPALRNPTVSELSREGWVAVETILDEKVVREIVPDLKRAGAEGIVEYPLNKVIF
jgi:ATP phosphoribosyltransferase